MRNPPWKPSTLQLVAISTATVSTHIISLMVDHMWDESWPLWLHVVLALFFGGVAWWATWLHNRRTVAVTGGDSVRVSRVGHKAFSGKWKREFPGLAERIEAVRRRLGEDGIEADLAALIDDLWYDFEIPHPEGMRLEKEWNLFLLRLYRIVRRGRLGHARKLASTRDYTPVERTHPDDD